jgi:hypothetical protein
MSTDASLSRRTGARGEPSLQPWARLAAVAAFVLLGVVIAGTAPVAAAGPTFGGDDLTVTNNETWIDIEEDHTITVEATDVDTSGEAATVTVDLSGWNDDAIKSQPSVTVPTSGVDVVGSVDTSGTTTTFDVNDTTATEIDFEAEIDVTLKHPTTSSLDGASYEIDATVADANGTATATAPVTLSRLSYRVDGTERFPPATEFVFLNQTVTVANLEPGRSYTLFEFDPEDGTTDPVKSINPGGTTTATIDTDDSAIGTGWYVVSDGTDVAIVEENAFQVRRHQLTASQASAEVDATGDGAETSVTIGSSLRTTAFDVNVTSPELDAEELFELFDGENSADVERVAGSDSKIVLRDVTPGDSIPMTFAPFSAATYEFEFDAADTGARDTSSVTVVEREADAEFGSDVFRAQTGDIVEVSVSTQDTDDVYVMIGGDRTTGENMLTNYFDILHVSGGATIRINTRLLGTNVPSEEVYEADGSVTSYMQEPNDPVFDDVTFEGNANTLEEFRAQIGVGDLPRPIQPDRYRLVAGLDGSVVVRDDGIPDFERPLARSNIHLTQSDGFGNVTTYIAPRASANDVDSPENLGELTGELTERRTVAKGDRIVFEIEARGLTGLVTWLQERLEPNGDGIDPPMLSTLLSFPDGFRIGATQTNPGMNEPVTTLDIDGAADGEIYAVPEPIAEEGNSQYLDRYYLVLDTRNTGPFDHEPNPGDEYRFRFGYNSTGETDWFDTVDHDAVDPNGASPHFPYAPADAENRTETRTVTIEEPTVEYDRTDVQDRPIVRSSEDGTISGVTNLAPGTDVTIQLIADDRTEPTRITIEDVDIGSDGVFEVTHDLSVLDPGESLEVEFYVYQELLDKRSGVVVGEDDDIVSYQITEHTENATARAGGSLEDVSATIENRGEISDRQFAELAVGDQVVGERAVKLAPEQRTTIDFGESTADLEPGEYTFRITTSEDEATGQLVIEGNESAADADNGTDADSGSDSGADSGSDSAETDDADDADEQSDDSEEDPLEPLDELIGMVPPVPIGARHAVGGAAIVGAAHVLGFWV